MRKLLICAVLAGCGAGDEVTVPNGKAMFARDCAGCHGADGAGVGPIAQGLGVVPPDLTGLAVRSGGLFPREAVMATIDGLNRPVHFADAMPTFGDGDLGEAVIVETPDGLGTPTPVGLIALADYLEAIQR